MAIVAPQQAALRYLRFQELKRQVFPHKQNDPDFFARPNVTRLDLTQADITALKRGLIQILPSRDAAGRMVALVVPQHSAYDSPDSLVRS